MIILIIVIGLTLLGAWILSPEINWIPKANDKNNEKPEEETMTETDIRLNIYDLCLKYGFIQNEEDLKIYNPIEKVKDDLFDEVFEIYPETFIPYKRHNVGDKICETRCVQNLRTREEITIVIPNGNYTLSICNKFLDFSLPIVTEPYFIVGHKKPISTQLFYSQREIEKQEIDKYIEQLNIPKYITCKWIVWTNSLEFYVEDEYLADLNISRKDLTKEKILQNIEECKMRYDEKHKKRELIKNEINEIFKH